MANLKINNKNYTVPALTFKHYTEMEEQGLSLIDAFQKKQIMLLSMAFTCVVVGCERDEAERLIEQHILGGGNLMQITEAMYGAMYESDFFRKMLSIEEPQKKKQTKSKSSAETEE